RTLDLHRDTRVLAFEQLGDFLGQREVDRGVPDHLAFLLGGRDQVGRDLFRRGGGLGRAYPAARRKRGRGTGKYAPTRQLPGHRSFPPVNARHRSAGKRSHTCWPGAMSCAGGAVTRSSVLSSSAIV